MDALFADTNTTQPLLGNNTGTGTPSTPNSGECTKQYVKKNSMGTFDTCTPDSNWRNGWGFFGGKRRQSMKRGGSFRPSSDLITAAPFSRGRTAQSHNWTGGRRRRRSSKRRTMRFKCNKCSKRRRHRH